MTQKNKNILVIAAIGTAVALSTGAYAIAQSPSAQMKNIERIAFEGKHDRKGGGRRGNALRTLLRNADTNNDGSVTQAEFDAYRSAQVTAADANSDGNISLEEFETIWLAQTNRRMIRAFQRLDANADGSITQAEQDERFSDLIDRLDRNGDGELNREDRPRRGEGRNGERRDRG